MFCKRIIKSSEILDMFPAFELSLKKCQEPFLRMVNNYVQNFFSLMAHHLVIQRSF